MLARAIQRLVALACAAAVALSVHAAPPTGRVAATFTEIAGTGTHPAKIRLLTDNVESWFARWYVLANAQKSIDVTYFIVENDIFGRSMLGLLYKKARFEGVKVRLMLDARGTKSFTRRLFAQGYLKAMVETGNVEIKVFNPWHKALLKLPQNIRHGIASNHDKIIIVDSEWAITGGRNVSVNYFADPKDKPDCYRDTDVLLQGGSMGAELTAAFTEEFAALSNYKVHKAWLWDAGEDHRLDISRRAMQRWIQGGGLFDPVDAGEYDRYLAKDNEQLAKLPSMQGYLNFQQDPWQGRRAYPVKVLDKHSFKGERNDITENMIRLIDQAEDYVLIQNPYVVITKQVMDAMLRAKDRGVRIWLHTNSPASTDSLITQAFFLRDWKKMLRDLPNLRIFAFHGQRKLHAKVFVIDDQVTSVGTYNMDPMSQGINSEVMAVVDSPEFARRCRLRIYNDIRDSVEFKIRVDEAGVIHSVHGPEDHLKGMKGWAIKMLTKLGFLRPLV